MYEEKLIIENERLVYHLLKKYYIPSSDYEDVASVAKIGLIKAAKTFDESKKAKFATYASTCIHNEIKMYFRKYNKQRNYVSLDEILSTDQYGNELIYRDIIPDEKSNYVEDIMRREECIELITKILNILETREKIIVLYKLAGLTQREIANILNISQSYISRIQTKTYKKLISYKDKSVQSKTIYFKKVNDYYQITFTEKSEEIIKVFSDIYSNSKLRYGEIRVKENSVTIILDAENEAFKVIADILYKIL